MIFLLEMMSLIWSIFLILTFGILCLIMDEEKLSGEKVISMQIRYLWILLAEITELRIIALVLVSESLMACY